MTMRGDQIEVDQNGETHAKWTSLTSKKTFSFRQNLQKRRTNLKINSP